MAKRIINSGVLAIMFVLAVVHVSSAATQKSAVDGVSDDAVVISVNDINYTKKDITKYQRLMYELYRNKHPNTSTEKLRIIKQRIKMSASKELISQAVMVSNLCTNKFHVSPMIRQMVKDDYKYAFCTKNQTFEELQENMQDVELDVEFDKHFNQDLQIKAALYSAYSNELVVTEQDYTNAIENVLHYNRVAEATNALICATMTNVIEKIKNGEDFAKLVEEYSQDENREPGGALEYVEVAAMSNGRPEYASAVNELAPGETTGILETDDGYEIVKRLPDIKADDEDDDSAQKAYARIFFRRPYYIPEVFDESFRRDLSKECMQTLLHKIQPEFVKKARISFPNGNPISGKK